MAKNLPDTNVGNNEYISKQAALECVTYDEEYTTEQIKGLPSADVVSKAGVTALLEETEKELVKGTDEMSVARCFIVSIMGIVKCKIMQMGEGKE